jgi:hypothetical protein
MTKKNKDEKYGNDEVYEAWTDTNIFCPLASLLVDPLYFLNLTPNMITIISTLFTLISIYFLHIKCDYLFIILFLLGYILDCVDGKMARRYNMGSSIGMALDLVSDDISHIILFIYLLINKPLTQNNIFVSCIIFILLYMLSLSYALNEAISTYNSTGCDNFYEKKYNELINIKSTWYETILYKLYLIINKFSYNNYKYLFPKYDIKKINYWQNILKHFGAGNYTIILIIILIYIN